MNSLGNLRFVLATLIGAACAAPSNAQAPVPGEFRRIASFPVFRNTSESLETAAEIVASADGGNLLVYTDSFTHNLGFVDITDPANPLPGGVVGLSGSPTSVAVLGDHALVCVDTSVDFVNPSGNLEIIDVHTRQIVRTIPLGGQPDAIALSPWGTHAVIAIENQRDEELGNGAPPQLPAGFVVIVDTVGSPQQWTTRVVDLVGVADLYPEDPEPEFVDVNSANIAVVTLQENNHVVLIRLGDGAIIGDFSAGTVDLSGVDANENDMIEQGESLAGVLREPDGVVWTSLFTLATANEGDLDGGSRDFTTWLSSGQVLHTAGGSVDRATARIGHYPEDRSENKGAEPEGIEFARYGGQPYLFVGSERANSLLVYRLAGPFGSGQPQLVQMLPTGVAPEGLHAIPGRDLFVVANEADSRADKFRATIMIYQRGGAANYPTILSRNRAGSSAPIPWGALSGLAASPTEPGIVYSLYDSFYRGSRIFRIDRNNSPARIESEIVLEDGGGVLLDALERLKLQLPGTDDFDPSDIVDAGGTVNLDAEGIAVAADGSFWIASEGAGNLVGGVSNPSSQPFESPNLLVRAVLQPSGMARITDAVFLPLRITRNQFRFGFEGVAVRSDALFVVFQRAWQGAGDPTHCARIGRYDWTTKAWSFAYYPLELPSSPNGGWVGLSELTHLGGDEFAVIERDDQGGPDARIKRIASFSIAGVAFADGYLAPNFPVVTKVLRSDLLADGVYDATGGLVPEKLEGLALVDGNCALIVNDNDGVDDNSGETQLLVVEGILD